MGDHFVLLVDGLLTESTLEATIARRNQTNEVEESEGSSVETMVEASSFKMNCDNNSASSRKLVECRICQDEDEDCNLETPCSCCGSLKYAHRKCIQRWCNEKGDTMCEICLQQFKPGYTAPSQLFQYGGVPMNFRGNWEISRRDLHHPRFIAMVTTNRNYSDASYDDYTASTARSALYCRSVAVIFVVLLVLRHTLPIIVSEDEHYSFSVFALLSLRIAGILVPVYVMARGLSIFSHRRRRQPETRELPVVMPRGADEQLDSSAEMQSPPHLIHAR